MSRRASSSPLFFLCASIPWLWLVAPEGSPGTLFREVAKDAGLTFTHRNGATGENRLPEIMGSGAALLDYDGDGDLDIYLVQSAGRNRLFRNEVSQTRKLKFTDVTETAGVGNEGYGMGAAVADYDNDGDLDLYVTNVGPNILYRNNGDGTFSDVTAAAGVNDPRWNAGASFVDYDRDGDLDLFVTAYVDFTMAVNKACYDKTGVRDYCSPTMYNPLPDRLYRNDGGGRFVDVSAESGIVAGFGNGLGVAAGDFNLDGWPDIYVANDQTPNELWINKGDGAFEASGLMSGTAYNAAGAAEAGMGIAVEDFDQDGDEDIFVTNLAGETNTLYVNDGSGNFRDETLVYRLAGPSLPFTGFGTGWLDYDHDGDLDLFIANGAVTIEESLLGEPYPYHQKNQLFRNHGDRFSEVSGTAGPALQLSEVSRGVALGDVDNDGDVDILVSNNNGPARLLLNQAGSPSRWLQVSLRDDRGNRHGIGARVALVYQGGEQVWRRVHTDGSYLSASDARVHFGIKAGQAVRGLLVRWPDGEEEIWSDVKPGAHHMLQRGSAKEALERGFLRDFPVVPCYLAWTREGAHNERDGQ